MLKDFILGIIISHYGEKIWNKFDEKAGDKVGVKVGAFWARYKEEILRCLKEADELWSTPRYAPITVNLESASAVCERVSDEMALHVNIEGKSTPIIQQKQDIRSAIEQLEQAGQRIRDFITPPQFIQAIAQLNESTALWRASIESAFEPFRALSGSKAQVAPSAPKQEERAVATA